MWSSQLSAERRVLEVSTRSPQELTCLLQTRTIVEFLLQALLHVLHSRLDAVVPQHQMKTHHYVPETEKSVRRKKMRWNRRNCAKKNEFIIAITVNRAVAAMMQQGVTRYSPMKKGCGTTIKGRLPVIAKGCSHSHRRNTIRSITPKRGNDMLEREHRIQPPTTRSTGAEHRAPDNSCGSR